MDVFPSEQCIPPTNDDPPTTRTDQFSKIAEIPNFHRWGKNLGAIGLKEENHFVAGGKKKFF